MDAVVISVFPGGNARSIYSDAVPYGALGLATIRRASHVEPTADGYWTADLSPVGGPVLGPYRKRAAALKAEIRWLNAHALGMGA